MTASIVAFTLICLLSACGCQAPTEPPKFGVVDLAKVVQNSKAGQKANAEIDNFVKAKQAELNAKAEALKKMEARLKEQPPKGKGEDFNRAAAEYQKLAAAADAELKKKAGETRNSVFTQMKKSIEVIGQEEKFFMIFTSDNIPYFQPATDITDKVIKKYDELAGGQ